MNPTFAALITKGASKQTYYTIKFLVDRDRVDDAYRAYAYFRCVDDFLDADSLSASERRAFIERQKSLLESCLRGEVSHYANMQEKMLIELVQSNRGMNSGLLNYLSNMMLVMDFDVKRRGKLISQLELNQYTNWLAIAVTENMHYFIGNGAFAPHDETRYLAVSAAHITHMLRDTYVDSQAGYFNIPREVLEANHIEPQDMNCPPYRTWVKSRVQLARAYFEKGRDYFRRVQNTRHRLAGFAYMARFEWLLETIEREGYTLRPRYSVRKSTTSAVKMGWITLLSITGLRGLGSCLGQLPQNGKENFETKILARHRWWHW